MLVAPHRTAYVFYRSERACGQQHRNVGELVSGVCSLQILFDYFDGSNCVTTQTGGTLVN
jgi:hypothetical protein